MGIDTIHGFMSRFGFGDNFAADISYARTGVLPSREWKMESRGEPWYPGDTINSSIGQGYMWATPLQLATAASIIANKGNVIEPRMLKAVEGQPYAPVFENKVPDVTLNDLDYWRYIEEAMTMVVHRPYSDQFRDYGTAYPEIAQKDPEMSYKLAGKSGTAQAVGISQDILSSDDIMVSDLNRDHALFIAFAPAMNAHIAPQIALAVFVENGESGGGAAGPIAKQLTDKYLLDILQIDFEALEDVVPPLEPETSALVSEADE
jgi:penicillin-binding protein 2